MASAKKIVMSLERKKMKVRKMKKENSKRIRKRKLEECTHTKASASRKGRSL